MNNKELSLKEKIDATLPTEKKLEDVFDRLWPICRSITGNGLRQSLNILNEILPLEISEVPTGQKVLDWTIPDEWNIEDAYFEDEKGNRFAEFKKNNLHLLGYSAPVDTTVDLTELEKNLFSLPEQPDAIPYRTTYYKQRWGFCLEDRVRKNLKPGKYHVVVKSTLKPGSLSYGECMLPSKSGSKEEILLSTYLCHPSMANNELSGPIVTAFLYQALKSIPDLKFNYRFVFVPETIGALAFLAKSGNDLKKNCKAGFVVTCCGDPNEINYKKSRQGNSLTDRCTMNVLENYKRESGKEFTVHEFFPTGSDERQYCSPGFNLPVGSLIRSMYGVYPEYHTSLDNKSFISFKALQESIALYLRAILSIEKNEKYVNQAPYGEPMLGPRGLYPAVGAALDTEAIVNKMMYVLNYSDGNFDLCDIAEKAECSILDLADIASKLEASGLLKKSGGSHDRVG